MTKKKHEQGEAFSLQLKFDVGQVTKAMNYQFSGEKGSIFQESGLCAGCFHFGDGGTLEIEVIGIGDEKHEFSYVINDLTITSRPTLPVPANCLSPFDKKNACVSIKKWGPFNRKNGKLTTISTKAKSVLPIKKTNGQWEMSGFLSVSIKRRTDKGKEIKENRLFYFDPEGTTGSGGDIVG